MTRDEIAADERLSAYEPSLRHGDFWYELGYDEELHDSVRKLRAGPVLTAE